MAQTAAPPGTRPPTAGSPATHLKTYPYFSSGAWSKRFGVPDIHFGRPRWESSTTKHTSELEPSMNAVLNESPRTARYAQVVRISKKSEWQIDRDVLQDREFDFNRNFLPAG